MLEQFPRIVDVDFSAQMEKNLDKIESGKADWRQTVDEFYKGFDASLQAAEKNMEGKKIKVPDEPSSEVCPPVRQAHGHQGGQVWQVPGLQRVPRVPRHQAAGEDTGGICPKCGKGRMLERKSARGRIYYGCERYPDCDFMTWDVPVPTKCEKCGATLFRHGSKLYCAKRAAALRCRCPKGMETDRKT